MYDGHNDGRPETVSRASTRQKAPLGIKILFALAVLGIVGSSSSGAGLFVAIGLLVSIVRVGLLYGMLKLKTWAWYGYFALQFVLIAFFGLLALAGSVLGVIEVVLAGIVVAYLYSIREAYGVDSIAPA